MRSLDPGPLLQLADRRARLARVNEYDQGTGLISVWEPARPTEMARVLGVTSRTVHRWMQGSRVDERLADEIVVRLERHPAEVWPDYYEREESA